MFIDEVQIKVISWKGWDWLVSWRREKYIPKWGPWWWDWGKGWDIYLQTDENLNTLSKFRNKKVIKAEKWENWWTNDKHWFNAPDLVLKVPVWTIVKDANSLEIVADLNEKNLKILVAKWWRWGFWNAHFCSSTRQAPSFAELWDVSEEKDLLLELKLVADIWIIWIPSAWKSSLISKITNVKPKIWDYPFTTLTPNLWVLEHKWKTLVLEDVPWLIPWASEGKGLGIEFLKHIERTWVLLHLLDLYRLDEIFSDYENIRKELSYFSDKLENKEEIIVFSKADLLGEEIKNHIIEEFEKKYKNKTIFSISSATESWIWELKDYLIDNFAKDIKKEEEEIENIKIYDLKQNSDPKKIDLRYNWNYIFEAKWERIEQIVRMTDFTNLEAVARIYDVLEKMWVMKKMEQKLEQVSSEEELDNSGFFEWNENSEFSPKIIIAWKEIELDKLRYNL